MTLRATTLNDIILYHTPPNDAQRPSTTLSQAQRCISTAYSASIDRKNRSGLESSMHLSHLSAYLRQVSIVSTSNMILTSKSGSSLPHIPALNNVNYPNTTARWGFRKSRFVPLPPPHLPLPLFFLCFFSFFFPSPSSGKRAYAKMHIHC